MGLFEGGAQAPEDNGLLEAILQATRATGENGQLTISGGGSPPVRGKTDCHVAALLAMTEGCGRPVAAPTGVAGREEM